MNMDDDLLFDFLAYDFTFGEETDILCPSCNEYCLTFDAVEEALFCRSCGQLAVCPDASEAPDAQSD